MQDMIRVSPNRLENDSEKIREYIERMQAGLDKINEYAASQNQMWEAEQGDTFKDDFRMDIEILKVVMQNLKDIYKCEIAAKNKYEKCEKKIEKIVSEMQIQG